MEWEIVPIHDPSAQLRFCLTIQQRVDKDEEAFGALTSDPAVLSLTAAPVQPLSQAVAVDDTAMFWVSMPDLPAYAYQWQRDGTDLPGETGAKLQVANAQFVDGGSYTVTVTLGPDAATSDPAHLTVLPAPSSAYATEVNTWQFRVGQGDVTDPLPSAWTAVAGR